MITVLKSGIHCSIQDRGRFGFRHLGVPISGCMDESSANAANLILNNHLNDAVLELGLIGPDLEFNDDTLICISGATKKVTLNQKPVQFYKRIKVTAGDVLSFKSGASGVWTYMAIKNGVQSSKVLGSRSTYLKADIGFDLIKGSKIQFIPFTDIDEVKTFSRLSFSITSKVIKVNRGPEWHLLNEEQQVLLLSKPFLIRSQSDRMGYYLDSDAKKSLSHNQSILTSPVNAGTLQLPPSGIPIVLMKDAQTTGGYPRVLQVVHSDLSLLSQKRAGEEVRFEMLN